MEDEAMIGDILSIIAIVIACISLAYAKPAELPTGPLDGIYVCTASNWGVMQVGWDYRARGNLLVETFTSGDFMTYHYKMSFQGQLVTLRMKGPIKQGDTQEQVNRMNWGEPHEFKYTRTGKGFVLKGGGKVIEFEWGIGTI